MPDYDPNRFVPSISRQELAEYGQNPASPFTNRCITGLTPGSTYKIPTALAGAMNGLARNSYTCSGSKPHSLKPYGCIL